MFVPYRVRWVRSVQVSSVRSAQVGLRRSVRVILGCSEQVSKIRFVHSKTSSICAGRSYLLRVSKSGSFRARRSD